MKSLAGILMLIAGVSISSCYWDSVEALKPGGIVNPCDTAQHAIYSQSIKAIMSYNCLSCHSSSYAGGNVLLDSYDNVKKYTQNGQLMKAVNRQSGTFPMPPSAALPACQIEKLNVWITNAYPQ